MHGMIFAEFKKFVHRSYGEDTWRQINQDAGITRVSNLATESYPDTELFALVAAAAQRSGVPATQLLTRFGEFIVPDLMKVFGAFVDKDWGALDLLQHTESVIHRAVRLQDPNAEPPKLRIHRNGPDQVTIVYSSARKLCAVATGIIRGVATYYQEPLEVQESSCMHSGDSECTLIATRVRVAA